MDKKYISLDAIVKDIMEGKIEVTGDPYAQQCVEAYRDVILKRLEAEPTITVKPARAVMEVDSARAISLRLNEQEGQKRLTTSLLVMLDKAIREHVVFESIPDLLHGTVKYQASVNLAVRDQAVRDQMVVTP